MCDECFTLNFSLLPNRTAALSLFLLLSSLFRNELGSNRKAQLYFLSVLLNKAKGKIDTRILPCFMNEVVHELNPLCCVRLTNQRQSSLQIPNPKFLYFHRVPPPTRAFFGGKMSPELNLVPAVETQ